MQKLNIVKTKLIRLKIDSNYSINWKDISIEKNDNGKPIIVLSNHSEISDNYRFDVSLSHVKEYAVANVVMYSKK